MTLVQKEIKKIYVWKEPYTDCSAMRGPCDEGFHIPLSSELSSLHSIILNGLGLQRDRTTMQTYLKMPSAGSRLYNNSNVDSQGSRGYYWSSSKGNSVNVSSLIYFTDYDIDITYDSARSSGCSIRPFKDSPVVPTSSWTTLYQGTGNAGIYHNQTDGLISLSSDGTNWITIADKNLGATTVYNNGDTLSESNCGKYYQWGNNYGFAWTGTVTKSSSQINASSYGPGNYYSSSTFICRTTNPFQWDSSDNGDLRGGETGSTQGGGDIQIRSNGWTPGSNTIYFPLNSEYQNNSLDGTKTIGSSSAWYFYNLYAEKTATGYIDLSLTEFSEGTVFGWINDGIQLGTFQSLHSSWGMNLIQKNSSTNIKFSYGDGSGSYSNNITVTAGWHSVVMVLKSTSSNKGTLSLYIDGQLQSSPFTTSGWRNGQQSYLSIYGTGGIAKVGFDPTMRTADNTLLFHDTTKVDFGL